MLYIKIGATFTVTPIFLLNTVFFLWLYQLQINPIAIIDEKQNSYILVFCHTISAAL